MEYKQHFFYQVGLSLVLLLLSFLILASTVFPFALIPLVYAGIVYLKWKRYSIVLEDNKIVLNYGLLTTHKEQVRLDKIQKIRISKSLSQSVFKNVGTIVLETGNDLTITLANVENYQQLYEQLEQKLTI